MTYFQKRYRENSFRTQKASPRISDATVKTDGIGVEIVIYE